MIYFRLILAILIFSPWTMIAHAKIPAITINPKEIGTTGIRLSDLIQSIEYIPLETNGNSLIGITGKLFDVSKNYILVWDYKLFKLTLFKRDGEFVAEIGQRGQGPGEYFFTNGFAINEEKQQIEFFTSVYYKNKLFIYDFKGNFQKEEPKRDPSLGTFLRKFGNNGLFLTGSGGVKKEISPTYKIATWNDFKVVMEAVPLIPLTFTGSFGGNGTGNPMHYYRNGRVYVRDTSLNDTIYQINGDFSFTPHYTINSGKHEMTAEVRSNTDKFHKENSSYVSYSSLFEMEKYFLMSYFFNNRLFFTLANKETGQLGYFLSEKGIPNDWDGGPDIWFIRQDEKTMYGFIPASDFLEYKNKLTPKGPQSAIQRMDELKDSLVEDDNPVFVIVTMK